MVSPPAPVKKVLVPITAGTEPVEACVPIDVLRRAGADVTVAAAGGGDADDGLLVVEVMYGVKIVADATIADCADASYDLVALPGGVPGAANLGGCAALESIVRRQALRGGLYAAICAAPPLALGRWGLLNGVKATAHPAFVEEFPAGVTAVDATVVVDGKVVTGSGPAPAMEFALALVEQLYGKDKADQIAKPMLVRYEPGYTFKEHNPVQWQCSGTRPKVLIPLANGSEEMESITIIDALRRANADVVVASAEDGVEVVGRYGMRIVADALLDAAAADQQFDLIIVPGGMPGAEKLVALLKKQAAANKPYGAIGAATAQVLEPHGLLKGKKAATCASMVAGLLADGGGEREEDSRVVVDGNVITSRSTGTAMEFAVAAVEKLMGREAAREAAEGLLFV
ncbi:unnamed protein product [Urochloa decumbens]|uniref:DJ-1/PfpI domain-containing protein n=1 Tax=Urochloa decumbens TaxID=240449 RepID=A0ABC8ZUG6_9POAL